MTGRGGPANWPAHPPRDRVEAYRRAAVRPPVAVQVERISTDIAALAALTAQGSPLARGAALALAHGALKLAVTPVVDAGDRQRRAEVLRGTALPALVDAGLGHAVGLVEAALAHDGDPAVQARGVERPQ